MRRITLIPAAGTPIVLCDGLKSPFPDGIEGGFNPGGKITVQQTALARAAYPFLANRFNLLKSWNPSVTHSFLTAEQCQDFVGNRDSVLGAFEIMIYTSTGQGVFTRYWKAALVTDYQIEDKCTSCKIRYSIVVNSAYSNLR